MKKLWRTKWALLLVTAFIGAHGANGRPPNIVLILADDLGYGDLGCYGCKDVETPHLDALAAVGVRFVDFHSNGAMCSPTRASIITGQYPQRLGPAFEGALDARTQQHVGIDPSVHTLPELLQEAGYATAIFGKWHLGFQSPYLPTEHGFQVFRGLLTGDGDHHSHIDRSGNVDWWKGAEIQLDTGYAAELITRYSVGFIKQHQDRPFFLYVPHLAIHFPWQGPDDPAHRQVGTDYRNDKWGLIPDPDNVRPHVRQMITSLDESVGQIVSAIRECGLERNTLVVFLSDNGGYRSYGTTHHAISSNGPLRGQKTEMYEGGHRIPAIVSWRGRIPVGVSRETCMSFDLVPTLLRIAEVERMDGDHRSDGVDLTDHLMDVRKPLDTRTLHWQMGTEWAVRQGNWKLVQMANRPLELFDLSHDVGESNNQAEQQVEVMSRLRLAHERWGREIQRVWLQD